MSVNDLNRIDAVLAKASRWQLTSIVPSAADIVDNANKNYSTTTTTKIYKACRPDGKINHQIESEVHKRVDLTNV